MKLTESLRISWRAITGHKLRSSLTTLGIIIGIGAVIVFVVLGGAFEQDILGGVDGNEEPVMTVNTQEDVNNGVGIRTVNAAIYTESDVSELNAIDGVDYVSPAAQLPAVQLRQDEQRYNSGFRVQATNGDRLSDEDFAAGEQFNATNEMVLTDAAVSLLGDVEPGDEIEVGYRGGSTDTFTVAGILTEQDNAGRNAALYVPLENYQATIETPDGDTERAYPRLTIMAEETEAVSDVKEQAQSYLTTDSDAAELKEDNQEITVQTIDDQVEQVSDIIDQLTILIGGIAGISLVVGSIGIANIMIVSVTERTREIGIMKAIGARKRDVIQLFIVEAIILGVIGALLGVTIGVGTGYIAVSIIGWPMVYPMQWVAIAVVIGMGVGVLSGLYPAWSAARVDPIEALRHE